MATALEPVDVAAPAAAVAIDTARPGPPGELLPANGPGALDAGLGPDDGLASVAGAFRRLVAGRAPGRWNAPAFVSEVELVRRQLAPIASRSLLGRSFAREARNRSLVAPERALAVSAVHVAYSLRWLELGGVDCPPWTAWLDAASAR